MTDPHKKPWTPELRRISLVDNIYYWRNEVHETLREDF